MYDDVCTCHHPKFNHKTADTHCRRRGCACAKFTAIATPAPVIEVCEHCGQDRVRAEFYGDGCHPAEQYDGDIPGPAGEHSFVRVIAADASPMERAS